MKTNSKVKGRKPLTQDLLREYLRYCESGHLVWNKRPWSKSTAKVGDKVGSLETNGYIRCQIFKNRKLEHQLVFLFFNGYIPKYIDHINGIRDDNRIENLREADKQSNAFNRKSHKNSTSKYKGVSWCKRDKNWQVSYCIGGKRIYIGKFNCEIEAAKAYDNTVREYHKEFQKVNINDFS